MFSLPFFFGSFFYEESFPLYILLRTILILYLLIIWAFTWVPVPSNILFSFLWVAVAKVALFRGLLHINAARKVATMLYCDGGSFPLNIFRSPSFSYVHKAHPYHWSFLEDHSNCWSTYFELYSSSPKMSFSSDNLSFIPYLWEFNWEHLIIICSSSDLSMSSNKAQCPIYGLEPLPLQ